MPASPFSYLICSLFLLGIWIRLFMCRCGQRAVMVWTGLLLAPAGPIRKF